MIRLLSCAALGLGLLLGFNTASFAFGDGLDRQAVAQGNSRTGGVYRFDRQQARMYRKSHRRHRRR